MNKFTKAIAAIMLIVAAIIVAGCNKPDEPNNGGGNNGNNDSDVRVTTYTPQEITATTAKCGGDVIVTEGLSLTEIGVCWSMEQNPTIDQAHLSTTVWNEPLVCTISDLEPVTKYYVRAYALRGLECYYGEERCFFTLDSGGGWEGQDGALIGVFSVSETKKIHFSRGNLQYQASTNTWRFAENQWDYIGNNNAYPSPSYTEWIDLFGWGTSGNSHGAICYQPWSISTVQTDYLAYGAQSYRLYDNTGMADWGKNEIINGGHNDWHTLDQDEWYYIFYERNTDSGIKYAKGSVNGVCGVILFPDNWNDSVYHIENANSGAFSYADNAVSKKDWIEVFQENGAVFLPACGYRSGIQLHYIGQSGLYWSATPSYNINLAVLGVYFDIVQINYGYQGHARSLGASVRLVKSGE